MPQSISFPKQRWGPETVAARRLWRSRHGGTAQPLTESQTAPRQTLQEQHKQAVKQARKDKTACFLAEVGQALAAGDQHVAYQTLKLVKLWKPSSKLNSGTMQTFSSAPLVNYKS